MTIKEFMALPLEGRKAIEEAILSLDKAIQDEYGFSMLDKDLQPPTLGLSQRIGSDLAPPRGDQENANTKQD